MPVVALPAPLVLLLLLLLRLALYLALYLAPRPAPGQRSPDKLASHFAQHWRAIVSPPDPSTPTMLPLPWLSRRPLSVP